MKVLHIITTLDRGGAEHHLVQLVRGQIDVGCSISVAYLKGSGELAPDLRKLGAQVIKAPPAIQSFKLRANDFDLVHAHLPRAELYALFATARSRNLITSRHVAGPFWPGFPKVLSQLASRLVENRSRSLICISKAVSNYLLSTDHCRHPAKLHTVYYGYEPEVVGDQSAESSDDIQVLDRRLRLSCIARLVPQKDLPTLLKAIRELKDRGFASHLKIAGSGPDLPALIQLCESLSISGQVDFVGRISNSEKFIAESDIFVLPSLYEGFGMVLLEAAAAGIPVIAARNTAMAEVVVDGVSGLLFTTSDHQDLADKIATLALDIPLQEALRDGGRERLANIFSVEQMVMETLNVYSKVATNSLQGCTE